MDKKEGKEGRRKGEKQRKEGKQKEGKSWDTAKHWNRFYDFFLTRFPMTKSTGGTDPYKGRELALATLAHPFLPVCWIWACCSFYSHSSSSYISPRKSKKQKLFCNSGKEKLWVLAHASILISCFSEISFSAISPCPQTSGYEKILKYQHLAGEIDASVANLIKLHLPQAPIHTYGNYMLSSMYT